MAPGGRNPLTFLHSFGRKAVSSLEVRLEHWGRGDGPLTEKSMMRVLESEGYEVVVYAYRAGTAFPEHSHSREKCDAVLQGTLRVTIAGVLLYLKRGNRLYIPAGTRHSAEVVGEETVLALDGTKW